MSSPPSVLILGAGGYLGSVMTTEFLLHRARFARLAILTTEAKKHKFADVEAQGIEIILGPLTSPDSFKGFTTVLSLLGNHAMALQPAIITAAASAGVTHFYPSEFGSDIAQGSYRTNRYFRDKHLTRQHLRATAAERPSFHYTLIVCGGFVEFAVMPIFGVDVEKHTFEMYGSAERREPLTAVRDVAKYTIESIFLPQSPTQERVFRVPGGLYAWNDVIDALEKVQGVKYTRTFLPKQEAVDAAKACKERGDVDGELAFSLKVIMGDSTEEGVPKPWDNGLFGFEPKRLEETLDRLFEERKGGLGGRERQWLEANTGK